MKKAIAAYAFVIILYTALILAMTGCTTSCPPLPPYADSLSPEEAARFMDSIEQLQPKPLVLDSAEIDMLLHPKPPVTGINRAYTAEEMEEWEDYHKQ